jgi:PAS domain S-box-containing protein
MKDKVIRILYVEDNPADARLVQELLIEAEEMGWNLPGFELLHVDRLENGLKRLDSDRFDVVLTDLDLPDSRASETFARLHARLPEMPIVVLTGREDERLARQTVRAGAEDYLFKHELSGSLLAHALIYAIERQQIKDELRAAQDELEERVEVRTRELVEANDALRAEFAERQQAEEALQESEARYRELVQQANVIVLRMDAEGRITLFNEFAQRFFGYTEKEILGQNVVGTIVPEQESTGRVLATIMADAYEHPETYDEYENENRRRDGERVWVAWRNRPFFDKQGRVTGWLCVGTDVTARKRAEAERDATMAAMRESEGRYRMVSELTSDYAYAFRVEPDGAIAGEWVTGAFERITGYTREELPTGESWDRLFHPQDLALVHQHIQTLLSGQPHTEEYRIITKEGQVRWLRAYGKPVWDETEGRVTQVYGAAQDITQRRESEERLQESEELYRTLFEKNRAVKLLIAPESGRIVEANLAACEFYGYSRQELQSMNIVDINQLPAEQVRAELSRAEREECKYFNFTHRLASGELCDVEVYSRPVVVRGRRLLYSIIHDITDRKQAEQALRESEARFRALAENSPDIITRFDSRFRHLYVSPAISRYVDLAPEDYLGKSNRELGFPEHLLEVWEAPIAKVFETGEPQEFQFEIEGRQGLTVFHSRVVPELDRKGQVWTVLAVTRDVTERILAETLRDTTLKALQKSQERYALAQRAANVGSWDWDIRTGDLYWSEQIEPLFGLVPGEFEGTYEAFLDCVHPQDRQFVIDAVDACVHEGAEYDIEHRIVWPDGTVRWVAESGDVTRDAEGDAVRMLGVVQDITARKQAEHEREQYAQQLTESNAELERFATIVSHDLRQPLRVVRGFLKLLRDRYGAQLDESGMEYVTYAINSTTHMQRMISGLLEYARVETAGDHLVPVDCEAVLVKVLGDLQLMVEERGAQVTHDSLPTVSGDPVQLERVFQNLVSNALKYQPEDAVPRVHISAQPLEGEWRFAVRDNGIGIEPRYNDQIFHVFRRLHSQDEYEGTGIGLAVCKRIIERHHGRIWVESEPGQGSTFYFTLPVA